ncbi:hypothetical protein G6F40_017232 [Rhizopus arrhizus]|nr:hypothetical protein G6F40_017232 [Rhizopus arrhizus]
MTPLPKAPNAPHMLCSAAGELATALNMLGVAPKAPWIWVSSAARSAVVLLESMSDTRVMVITPVWVGGAAR